MRNRISECIQKSVEIFNTILCDENLLQTIEQIVELCIVAFRNDKKMLALLMPIELSQLGWQICWISHQTFLFQLK